jgi:hypothetical protein
VESEERRVESGEWRGKREEWRVRREEWRGESEERRVERGEEGGPLSGLFVPVAGFFPAPPALQSLRLFRYPPKGDHVSFLKKNRPLIHANFHK